MIKQPLIERFGERLLTAVRERDMINIKKLIKFDIDINYYDSAWGRKRDALIRREQRVFACVLQKTRRNDGSNGNVAKFILRFLFARIARAIHFCLK